MDRKALGEYLAIAGEAALAAGKYLLDHKGDVSVESEHGKDVKISADRRSERIIMDILRDKSDFAILSEEEGLVEGATGRDDLKWLVDPLDGSLNFLRGNPLCCVSVGLWAKSVPILGVIYDFNRGELFSGIAGIGAWLNGDSIRVAQISLRSEAVLLTGFPVNTDFSSQALKDYIGQVMVFKKIRLMGSAALSLAYVAAGRADAYYERDIMIWDIAAGLAILLAAGGKYSMKETGSNAYEVYATNGYL